MSATPSVHGIGTAERGTARRRAAMLGPFVAVVAAQVAMVFPAPTNGLIQAQLHTTASQLSWVSAIFFLPTAVLELSFGIAGDLFGRKRLLVAGCFVVAAGDLLGAVIPSIGALLAGQVIAGIGAAAVFPTSLTMMAQLNPGEKERAGAVAQWTMGIALGVAGGPLISGAIGLGGSYRPAFAAVTAIAVAAGVIAQLTAVDSSAPEGRRLDLPGQATVAVALAAILYGVIEGADLGWTSAPVIAAFAAGAVFLIAFVLVEDRAAVPMINLAVFKIPSFTGAALVAMVAMTGFLGTVFSVSIRVTVIQGQSSMIAGLVTLILNIVPFLTWPVFGRILYRVPPRVLMSVGLVCLAGGEIWASQVPLRDLSPLWLSGPLLLLGLGFNAVVATTSAAALDAVPPRLLGIASGATNLMRDFGQAIGVAIAGAIAAAVAGGQLPGLLARAGLNPRSLAIATGILHAGGPVAVAHASIGPASATTIPLAQQALWHGYSAGMAWCCVFSLIGLVIALITMRPAPAPV